MGDAGADVEALRKQIADLQVALKAKEIEQGTVAPYSKTYGRTMIGTVVKAPDGGASLAGKTLTVGGWVKTGREAGAGAFAFLELNDGSSFGNLQVMISKEVAAQVGGLGKVTSTGTSVLVEGELAATPEGTRQPVELKATAVRWVGACDNSAGCYPLAKKAQSMEFLREKMHLRPRTNTIGAVARIRSALAFATHAFFRAGGFAYVHTPIITTADCEGAGEMFQVTTLLSEADKANAVQALSPEQLAALQAEASAQGGRVKEAKVAAAGDKKDAVLQAAVAVELEKLQALKKQLLQQQEIAALVGGIPRVPGGGSAIDYQRDFFGRPAYLTVSGQLQGELYASALSNVYTFGPTFRAEDSNTSRHLAEFWMIEPEMAFCDLADDMQCAEDYVKYCCSYLLEHCMEDLQFINSRLDKTCIERLRSTAASSFKRVSYTEAIALLEKAIAAKKVKFEFEVKWGIDMSSEHEKYLTGEVFKQPIIVYDYPREIKAFYMRLNDDGKTVAAMDVLVPKIGELIGGSQREERLDVLERRITEAGMPLDAYTGYLDLRRYGSVPHSGFGLGFERLIMFATGLENIRDVIPFPRWPGHAEY